MKANTAIPVEYNRNSSKNMRALLIPYPRVSTKPQGDGMSLEEQRPLLDSIKSAEYALDEHISEIHSARNEHETCERAGLNRAMKLALEIDTDIVVTSASRHCPHLEI